jgi:glycosyltransferase involved in cell wall biosynthesis
MNRKIRVVHVINSFQFGGAEAMLCSLLLKTNRERFEPFVVSLINDLTVAGPVLGAGIPIVTASMRPGIPDPRGVMRLASHLRRLRPDVVQTWMDHSNLIGALAASQIPRAHIVWGIHHSNHVPGVAKRMTQMTVRCCAMLSSRIPGAIVFCSEGARTLYEARGFDPDKAIAIPNGFDMSKFRPSCEARCAIRREIGVEPNAPLIGLVARYDPCKDHGNFLRAAALLLERRPEARFVLCGAHVNQENQALVALMKSLRITDQCRLLGARRDVARIYAALDVNASSSFSEAFPLALGESMACGVPCVATDVGDSKLIVGDTGRIVPPRDPQALAAGLDELLSLSPDARRQMGQAARARISDRFDLGDVTRRYEELYARLISGQSIHPVMKSAPRVNRVPFREAVAVPGVLAG